MHNIGLAIWRLKYFYETFVQGSTAGILLNFSTKNPPHRQAANRPSTHQRICKIPAALVASLQAYGASQIREAVTIENMLNFIKNMKKIIFICC
ncbi:MAG: hypothetical protein QM610_14380 [Chitinophagaceae bacterium]